MKSIEQTNFNGKKVLVRVDYNVPLNENFQVTDVTRIKRTIPTVSKIIGDGGIAILMSHLGRPKGQVNDSFSLKHILPTVSEILGKKVVFASDVLSDEAEKVINSLKPGDGPCSKTCASMLKKRRAIPTLPRPLPASAMYM